MHRWSLGLSQSIENTQQCLHNLEFSESAMACQGVPQEYLSGHLLWLAVADLQPTMHDLQLVYADEDHTVAATVRLTHDTGMLHRAAGAQSTTGGKG